MMFIVRDKETQVQWIAKSKKRAWNKASHAKLAFSNNDNRDDPKLKHLYENRTSYHNLKFDEQSVYEIIELKTDEMIVSTLASKTEIRKELGRLVSRINANSHLLSNDARNDIYNSLLKLDELI